MNIPKFEKRNHHYVPQYWQRGFRTHNGQLFGRVGDDVNIVSTKHTMQQDWLYTIFDHEWRPSDALEDVLSAIEAKDAKLIQRLHLVCHVTTAKDRKQLCELLALQASRHSDILQRGHNLSKEFGTLLSNVHDFLLSDFKKKVANYGIDASDAYDIYIILKRRTKVQLLNELDELLKLSPQSPQLPSQDAILAAPKIKQAIFAMNLCLLDAPQPMAYVLGDTPIPQSNLSHGFSVPLSQSLAVIVSRTAAPQPLLERRIATQEEVDGINKIQWDNAARVIIGPSAQLLNNL